MTLPVFKAVATGSETSVTWPTHAAGDFAFLAVEHANTATTITTPSGWTVVPGTPVDAGASNVCLSAFYRFATSSGESAVTIAGTVNHKWATMITYTGVNTVTPLHGITTAFWGPSSTAIVLPGIFTLIDDCMILNVLAWGADDAGPLGSGEANATVGIGAITEQYDAGTITANGGGLVLFDFALATHGATQPSTINLSTTSLCALMVVALAAADKTFPTQGRKTQVVNR